MILHIILIIKKILKDDKIKNKDKDFVTLLVTYVALNAMLKEDTYGRKSPITVSFGTIVDVLREADVLDRIVSDATDIDVNVDIDYKTYTYNLLKMYHDIYIVDLSDEKDKDGFPVSVKLGVKGIKTYKQVKNYLFN